MSLSKLVQDNVAMAFDMLGDLTLTATYTGKGAYDPSTGAVAAGQSTTFNAVLTTYGAYETNGTTVQANDRKMIANAASLSIEPSVGGTITAAGVGYEIIAISQDPALATYEFQLRR